MGIRTSDRRRVPGNPLGGVLRSTARAARTVRRPSGIGQTDNGQTPDTGQSAVSVCPPGPVVLSAVLECDTDSRVTWLFSTTLAQTPVVSATVASGEPMTATVEYAGPDGVGLLLWTMDGWPAPSGTDVHVIAVVP